VDLIRWIDRPEGLREPAVVCAFRGWNDAGEAASTALAVMVSGLGAHKVAAVDGEEIFDYQTTRPTVSITSGVVEGIEWPDMEIFAARAERAPRDLVLVNGSEPSYRWRTFCGALLDMAEDLGARMLVTLGALLADVPHTRPIRVGGLASSPELIAGKGLRAPTYQGPTGIVGVLHALAAQRGLAAASVWSSVPHYLGSLRSAPGALALVRTVEGITGVAVDATELERAVGDYERQVNSAAERDQGLQELIGRLEREADREESEAGAAGIPSADDLAQEIERFLRQRNEPGA
jgi:proteasome assembly chaperone (PAC2) family protein